MKELKRWSGALTVLAITIALVLLDLTDQSVHRFWSRHSFSSSVVSGVLVLMLTVLVVDRVARIRQLRNQSRAIGAQAGVILAQAKAAADAITKGPATAEDQDAANNQLRTYAQVLLISTPVLIDASIPRAFLETAQRLGAVLYRALEDPGKREDTRASVDKAVADLRAAAAPLLAALSSQELAAVSSDDDAASGG